MKRNATTRLCSGVFPVVLMILAAALFGAVSVHGQYQDEVGLQVLTRGPMHEAFAQVAMSGPAAGIIVSRAPYGPVEEIPPEIRPEGPDVAWIPGYWAWDEDRGDFIWISGVWRVIPPGREWVPGYWAPAGTGMQWISGFWREINVVQMTYLPPPPEPLELGPSSPMPGPDRIWSPGCWVWQDSRYFWRPGYWVVQRPDWVWVPPHYSWTPRGSIYVPGYWDYDISYRGVMFAPVYYQRPLFRTVGYVYRPSIVINLDIVTAHIFIQPRTRHYYFGDYYDYRYEDRGFFPWYSNRLPQYGPDPMYAHFRMRQLKQNPNWDNLIRNRYRNYRENELLRPPHTLALQSQRSAKADAPLDISIGQRFTEAVKNTNQSLRFSAMNRDERNRITGLGQRVRQLQEERVQKEAAPVQSGTRKNPIETAKPVRTELSTSPIAARAGDGQRSVRTPPPVPDAPQPKMPSTPTRSEVQRERAGITPSTPTPTQQRTTTTPEWSARDEGAARTPAARAPEATRTTPAATPAVRAPEATRTTPAATPAVRAPEATRTTPAATPAVRAPEATRTTPAATPAARAPAATRTTPAATPAARAPEATRTTPAATPAARAPAASPATPTPNVPKTAPARNVPTTRAPAATPRATPSPAPAAPATRAPAAVRSTPSPAPAAPATRAPAAVRSTPSPAQSAPKAAAPTTSGRSSGVTPTPRAGTGTPSVRSTQGSTGARQPATRAR
ncbi:MAG: BcpO-related WXXGXW repeat protein [Candidatus Hydrogenedentes bacterium]|nr:BcpO-related WXXGXW repeat protein [Candidatus Hydrogenedentota bacterium]